MALRVGTPMPSLDGATEWLNGEVTTDDLLGHPVLVHFWAISCPFCKLNLPKISRWRDVYAPHGLRFVAVHMPRGEADTRVEAISRDVVSCEITEPCAVDNLHHIGERFNVDAWPYYFLFDTEGKTRSCHSGEFGLRLAEKSLNRLLAEQGIEISREDPA